MTGTGPQSKCAPYLLPRSDCICFKLPRFFGIFPDSGTVFCFLDAGWWSRTNGRGSRPRKTHPTFGLPSARCSHSLTACSRVIKPVSAPRRRRPAMVAAAQAASGQRQQRGRWRWRRRNRTGGRVGFGARPVPPPLTRANLLMVSAVGASCLAQPAIACSQRVPDAFTCSRLRSVLVWCPRSRARGFTAGGSESLGCALQYPQCLQTVTGDALTDDANIADLIPGDLGDLIPALDAAARPAWHAMQPAELAATLATRGKCSALVKVTGEQTLLLRHPSSGAVTSPVAACSTRPASTAVSVAARCEPEQTIT